MQFFTELKRIITLYNVVEDLWLLLRKYFLRWNVFSILVNKWRCTIIIASPLEGVKCDFWVDSSWLNTIQTRDMNSFQSILCRISFVHCRLMQIVKRFPNFAKECIFIWILKHLILFIVPAEFEDVTTIYRVSFICALKINKIYSIVNNVWLSVFSMRGRMLS